MPVRLLLAPAAAGKTHACLEQVRAVACQTPFAPVVVVLPDRNQAGAFRRRLAAQGGALGVEVCTFGDLYTEILSAAGRSLPVAAEPIVHRVLRAAVEVLVSRNQLHHYAPIQHYPGFIRALSDLIAELKRARIEPEQFARAVHGQGPRLEELAALYAEYQAAFIRLGWADPEGLGWLAVLALRENASLLSHWCLLAVDGFDSFNPTQLETLVLLAGQVRDTLITLSGEPGMPRVAHRRFARTLQSLQEKLAPALETLPPRANPAPALAHLSAGLFEAQPARSPAEGRVAFIEAQTPAHEAREALRWLKARIVRDGVKPGECALIARSIAPYQPFLIEAAQEFGLPLRFAEGQALAGNPALAAVLNVLDLPLTGWARRPLLDALRTPYFDRAAYGLTEADAARLDEAARRGQVVAGLDQWEEALTRLARLDTAEEALTDEDAESPCPQGEAAATLWRSLQAFGRRVTPPGQGTTQNFVAWLEELLEDGLRLEARISAQTDTAARDLAALQAFRATLYALVVSEQVLGQAAPSTPPALPATLASRTFADFYADLRGAVEAATYRFDPPQALPGQSLYAANLAAARGVSYGAVAVLGLSEGLFPAPLTEDPFLSDEERDVLRQAGLPLEPRLRSDQQTLFYEAVTRATDYLLLTRPYLAGDGESWEPSPYWNAALELVTTPVVHLRPEDSRALADAASVGEVLAGAVRRGALPRHYAGLEPHWRALQHAAVISRARQADAAQGVYEGDLGELQQALSARYGAAHVWSPSRLETYGACGFYFFIQHALDLEQRETPQAGYDVAQLGTMLHRILEEVYTQAGNQADEESLLACLPDVARNVFATAPEVYGFRPTPWWESQQAELLEKLETSLRNLAAEAGEFQPAHFEVGFGFTGQAPLTLETDAGTVQVHGVVDRIDQAPDGQLRIIDYKAGGSHLTPRDLQEGRRLQLPLYALAAEQNFGGRVTSGFYWKILAGEAGSLRLERFEHAAEDGRALIGVRGAVALTLEFVSQYVAGVSGGRYAPAPPRGGCPAYCPAQLFCWRYAPAAF
jgi:ATP-dependent helicase/nuclease subunit B